MISPKSSVRFTKLQPQPQPAHKTLVSMDLDGSLISPSTPASVATLNKLHDEGKIYTLINTGNDLELLQKFGFGQRLAGLKLDCLSLSDGRDIFFNPDVNKNTPERWFNRLTYQHRDPNWHKTVYASGWRTTKVVRIIDQALKTQNHPGPAYVLDTHNTGFKGDLSPQTNKEDIQKMIKLIQQEFLNNGINAHARYSEKPERGQYGRFYVVFNPVGVHKGAPMQYLVKLYPQLKSAVTLGDGPNDKEMLVPESFGQAGSEIPNYPILVGMRQVLVDLLQGKKHVSFTTEAEVPNALKKQVEKAQAGHQRPDSTASTKPSSLWQSLKCWK